MPFRVRAPGSLDLQRLTHGAPQQAPAMVKSPKGGGATTPLPPQQIPMVTKSGTPTVPVGSVEAHNLSGAPLRPGMLQYGIQPGHMGSFVTAVASGPCQVVRMPSGSPSVITARPSTPRAATPRASTTPTRCRPVGGASSVPVPGLPPGAAYTPTATQGIQQGLHPAAPLAGAARRSSTPRQQHASQQPQSLLSGWPPQNFGEAQPMLQHTPRVQAPPLMQHTPRMQVAWQPHGMQVQRPVSGLHMA